MKSNIRYADILFIALAISYFILGILNELGKVSGKIILLCSIVSFVIAIVQMVDFVISALKMVEINVIKTSFLMLQAWYYEHKDISEKNFKNKMNEFRQDRDVMHKKYTLLIKILSIISNITLICIMVIFLIGLSTDYFKENSIVADTLTLFSFAIIFLSLLLHTYLDNYIDKFNQLIESTIKVMEEKAIE